VHLLDTDILSLLQRGNAKVVEALEASDDSVLAITLITKIELLRGRHDFVLKAATGEQLLRAEKWLKETELFLLKTPVIYPDTAAATQFDRLRLMKLLRKIGRADLLIASIVLANDATLVTRVARRTRPPPRGQRGGCELGGIMSR
jgi:tRNA(fMet)-specific endonuclease VapC